MPDESHQWWDLRLHPAYGTLEVRAADVQTRVEDSATIAALVQALVFDLASRYDAGELLPAAPGERIAENAWLATRDGVDGWLIDLETGRKLQTSERLLALAERLLPAAAALGCDKELLGVGRIVRDGGGAESQRRLFAEGPYSLMRGLALETISVPRCSPGDLPEGQAGRAGDERGRRGPSSAPDDDERSDEMTRRSTRTAALIPAVVLVVLLAFAASGAAATQNDKAITGTISFDGVWSGTEAAHFKAVIKVFEQAYPGVDVRYKSVGDNLPTVLATSLAGGRPPDMADIAQPGLVKQLAGAGSLRPIEYAKPIYRANFSPAWLGLSTFNGKLYGLVFKAANKSTVWYNVHAFKAAGVKTPATWRQLLNDAITLRASGVPAYSIGGSDGWTLTDLFENIYLRQAGAAKYKLLSAHKLRWTDKSVTAALRTMAQILRGANVYGGTSRAVQTDFPTSVNNVFQSPPKAAMVFEGDFVPGVATVKAKALVDYNEFAFPSIGGSKPAVVIGGDTVVAFRDTPAIRAFVKFLGTPAAAAAWARFGGFATGNRHMSAEVYPDSVTARTASVVATAKNVVFDMSDQQPSSFGATIGQGEWGLFQELPPQPRRRRRDPEEARSGGREGLRKEQVTGASECDPSRPVPPGTAPGPVRSRGPLPCSYDERDWRLPCMRCARDESRLGSAVAVLVAALAGLTVFVTGAVADSAPTNTSLPTITGTAQEGHALTVQSGSWSGTNPIVFAYQWKRCDRNGAGCVDIAGAAAQTYTLAAADVGATLRISVTATNAQGSAKVLSDPSSVVGALNAPLLSVAPAISGTAQQGATLTASSGSWTGSPPISYAYAWQLCDSSGAGCVTIGGATGQTFAPGGSAVGHTVRVQVTASNAAGSSTAVSGSSAMIVGPGSAPANTSRPTVSGTVSEGSKLSVSQGSWQGASPISYAYGWQRCDASGNNCSRNLRRGARCTRSPTATWATASEVLSRRRTPWAARRHTRI